MAENQENTQQSTPTFNPIQDTNPNRDSLIEALNRNTEALNAYNSRRGGKSPKEASQVDYKDSKWNFQRSSRGNSYRSTGNIVEDIENGIRDGLLDAISGGNFKKGIQGALSEFTNQFGFQLKDLPNQYGRHLGKQLANTKLGKAFSDKFNDAAGKLLKNALGNKSGGSILDAFAKGAGGSAGGAGELGGLLKKNALTNAQQAANAEKLFGKIDKLASNIGVGGGIALAVFMIAMKPFFEGLTSFFKSWGKAAMKDETERKKKLANAQKRLQADMDILVKEPFEILKKAAEEWEKTWDANLSKIALTQGYDKESVYELYSSIAERLNEEGLGSAIPATDVVNNLSKILETGLSGAIAEAFAYESTWLSAAIPTEDFTGYAATYAQLASDAINAGKSQEEAIAYANSQLETFASNLLYSSRTLSGGFTTGLKDAQSLFKDSVEIAQTAKTHNAAEISGTLTAVAGVIGAIAPDLAQGLVQNVVSAAIGGNSSSLVALRSLTGSNAGNTEFLRQLANDPQTVFATIFRNLSNLQNMSPANYMEVAEGLSSVFGVDMKALARVDFNLLADKVADMQVNTASLQENLSLLQEGQATVTEDQLRYQEINNDILNNGLAYVIDSEYGRMIQQHMWDEQLANQLSENEYAVNLQGSALEMLEGLRHTVANILSFLNPLGWVADKVAQVWAVNEERKENSRQIAEILERGAVGSNHTAFSNLTNVSGQNLQLTTSLIEMMGGTDYKKNIRSTVADAMEVFEFYSNPLMGVLGAVTSAGGGNAIMGSSTWNRAIDEVGGMDALFGDFLGMPGQTRFINTSKSSRYSGFNVSKSTAALISGSSSSGGTLGSPLTQDAEALAFAANKDAVNKYLASMQTFDWQNQGIDAFYASAEAFGFQADQIQDVLKEYGVSDADIRNYAEASLATAASTMEEDRKKNIQEFIEQNRNYWDYDAGSTGVFQTAMWIPFFGNGQKYDTRMDMVDTALTNIQNKIGNASNHTVISGIEELSRKTGEDTKFTVISALTQIESDIDSTFMSSNSAFQRCLADWLDYIAASDAFTTKTSKSSAWSELKQAEGDAQKETMLALANAMNVFSAEELQKLDPQLQTNVLLGEIVVILQSIMQQNNNQVGGLGLIDTISALGLGITTK